MAQVSVMLLRALVATVERAGVERARFLAAAGLAPLCLEDASARLDGSEYGRAVRTALAITGDPALGFRMGAHTSSAAFDVLGHLTMHTASLRAGLEMSARYSRLLSEGPGVELWEAGDRATVRFTKLTGEAPELRFTAEFATSAFVCFALRLVAGEEARPHRVLFGYKAPRHRDEYRRAFGGRERFEQDFTGVELDRAWLDRKQLFHSPELCAVLQLQAERLLARLELDVPVAERVKRSLAASGLQGRPSMAEVAREIGMSERSLRRRLRSERVVYRALLDEVLALASKRLLADPHTSIQEAAYAMGFETASSFSRAFKRWTGQAPRSYRDAG